MFWILDDLLNNNISYIATVVTDENFLGIGARLDTPRLQCFAAIHLHMQQKVSGYADI